MSPTTRAALGALAALMLTPGFTSAQDADTPTTPPVTAPTCGGFIELEDPWRWATAWRGVANPTANDPNADATGDIRHYPAFTETYTGTVWLAVDTIEYVWESTMPKRHFDSNGRRVNSGEDVEGVAIRMKDGNDGFLLEGAILADMAAAVRCPPVAVTTEDPPTPAPE